MCFAIPYKIIDVKGSRVYIENGKEINLGKDLKAKTGDYVQVVGNIGVKVLSQKQGKDIRKLIKELN